MVKQQKDLEILMQSRSLVETSYNVTAVQNRVFYCCLFSAQKEKSGELCCTVKLEDVKKLIPNPNQRTLDGIKKIFRVFKNASLLFSKEDEGDLIECDYNLISGCEYNVNKQEFKVFFMERLYNHILSYKSYAPLNLEIVSKYTSFYSQRLYEALRLWSRAGHVVKHTFTVDALRFILGVGDKYHEYKNLKQRVLNQAIKEINAIGNMEIDVAEIKDGRKVIKLEFSIYDKEPKTYFKNGNWELKEDAAKNLNYYVEFPETSFFSPVYREKFIKHCYAENLYFDDCIRNLYNSSVEVFAAKKKINKIEKLSDYKYFLGIFDNKVEDDIRQYERSRASFKDAFVCVSNACSKD